MNCEKNLRGIVLWRNTWVTIHLGKEKKGGGIGRKRKRKDRKRVVGIEEQEKERSLNSFFGCWVVTWEQRTGKEAFSFMKGRERSHFFTSIYLKETWSDSKVAIVVCLLRFYWVPLTEGACFCSGCKTAFWRAGRDFSRTNFKTLKKRVVGGTDESRASLDRFS